MDHPSFEKLLKEGTLKATDAIFPVEIGLKYFY